MSVYFGIKTLFALIRGPTPFWFPLFPSNRPSRLFSSLNRSAFFFFHHVSVRPSLSAMTQGPKRVTTPESAGNSAAAAAAKPAAASPHAAGSTADASYTWEEVAAHNCEATGIWISVDESVYAIPESFYDQHPGGKEYLLLAAGRDCTDLIASYHPFTSKPAAVLKSFRIGALATRQYPKFKPDDGTGFYSTLRKRVGDYFRNNKIDEKSMGPSIMRMSAMAVVYVFSYTAAMTNTFAPFYAALQAQSVYLEYAAKALFAVLLGWSQVMFLLHIMHDCSHSALGHSESIWKLGGRMFSETIVGSSMVCWQNQHVVGHHIYTNVYSIDPDLPTAATGDMRLIAPQQFTSWLYKYQHLYLLPLYGLFTFKSRIQDLEIYLSRKNGPIAVNPVTPSQWLRLLGSKLTFTVLRVVIPLMLLPSWKQWAALSFLAEFVSGEYLAINFQVSHVSTEAEFPVAALIPSSASFPVDAHAEKRALDTHVHGFSSRELSYGESKSANSKSKGGRVTTIDNTGKWGEKTTMHPDHRKPSPANTAENAKAAAADKSNTRYMWDMAWAELQVRTSVDYAHASAFCTFMCGALNYQTEHHLFPTVSQYHYPAIAPIVRQTCADFGIKYNYIETFTDAMAGHHNHLKEMGAKGIFCYPKMD